MDRIITLPRPESGRIIGHGVVTKWEPKALREKSIIQARHVREGLVGLALERETLLVARMKGIEPYDIAESYNQLVNGGTNFMLLAITVAPGTFFNNANSALGVGDSAAAYAGAQTNLQGAVVTTDRIRKAMNATFPSVAANVLSAQATFATTEANFVWNEWGFFNALADATGTMLNRAVANLGTKTNAVAWQLTVTLTLT